MARGVDRIEQEIAMLEEAVAAIAQEFQDTYRQYLGDLGQAVRQQLIQASYHLCTRGYPDQFLKLSLSERQELQQSLQQLSKQSQTQLIEALQPPKALKEAPPRSSLLIRSNEALGANDDSLEALSESISVAISESLSDVEVFTDLTQLNEVDLDQFDEEEEADEADEEEGANEAEGENEYLSDRPLNPNDLAKWQEKLEKAIVTELQNLSHLANRLLQQTNILPRQLPEPVLEVATKSDLASEAAGPPNLLNLLVEAETDNQKQTSITHVVAIRLRLSEVEFNNPTLSTWRSKLRILTNRLTQLGQEYQKKKREKAIAEAEAAWRSSWYEE
jgi:hypothetical protein